MAKISWLDSALDDLYASIEYIELDNPQAAENLINKVFNKIDRLEDFPLPGKKPKERIDGRFLEIVINPFRIFYAYDQAKNHVMIRLVIRDRQDLISFLAKANSQQKPSNPL